MGRTRRSVLFSVFTLYLCVSATYVIGNDVGCDDQQDCRRCTNFTEDDDQTARRCMKCRNLIVVGSRKCVDQCPAGYREEWSNLINYMGRICTESSFLGLPVRLSAIVVGVISGVAFCIVALTGGFLYLRHRRRIALAKHSQCSGNSNFTCEEDLDTPERREFLKHIAMLRCEAPLFLAMLNDTRQQVRDLKLLSSSSDSSIQAFRPVLMDLVRILTLLNRLDHQIGVPPSDWRALFAWGERVLRRYKRQNPHQVAQAQLVNFLQAPIAPEPVQLVNLDAEDKWSQDPMHSTLQLANNKTASTNHVTINNNNNINNGGVTSSSNQSLQQLAVSTFSSNYDAQPKTNSNMDVLLRRDCASQPPPHPSWEFIPDNHTILAEWPSNQDFFLDDDFITLGFRPQDEITTEL